MKVRVTILGCGTSGGVPQLHFGWGKCDPNNPRNRRNRCSILIETDQQSLLVDTTPECRQQLEHVDISRINGLIFTHTHADHCHGIDETRWICQSRQAALDVYLYPEHLHELEERFPYVWIPLKKRSTGFYKPVLVANPITEHQKFTACGLEILPLKLDHGFSKVMGLRIGDFAYCTDVSALTDADFALLEGVKIWIVDCLRPDPHPTHAHLERTLEWIERLKPEQAFLTHMNNDMDYDRLCASLPSGVRPAHDGLVLEFTLPT